MFRPENIEFTIGSSVYVQTTRHGCQESVAVSELEHLRIETRSIDEMFASVMGEYVFLK